MTVSELDHRWSFEVNKCEGHHWKIRDVFFNFMHILDTVFLILYSNCSFFHNGIVEPSLEQHMLVFNFTSKCSP